MPLVRQTTYATDLVAAERWEALWARFLQWEYRVGAFEYLDHDIPLWEYVRVPVFLQLQQACGFLEPQPYRHLSGLPCAQLLKDYVSALTWANPFLAASRPILFVTIARRVWYHGHWRDPYVEPFLHGLGDTYIRLERPEGGKHLLVGEIGNTCYSDVIASVAACARRLVRPLSSKLRDWLGGLESDLVKEFNVHVPVQRLGCAYLAVRCYLRWLYRQLLKRLRPRVCIIVAINPAERALVEVCRDLGIVTAELQHGMIGPYDLTYSTPCSIHQRTYPDYILTFGPFWRKHMSLPVSKERIIDVGFPFLENVMQEYDGLIRQPIILVLSQPGLGEALANWAVRLAEVAPSIYTVAFRPHPAERHDENRLTWLMQNGVRVLDINSPLYELLATSSIQVGVFSTALYEGLAFGLRTYIAPLPGYQYMRPLLKQGWVRLLENECQPFQEDYSWPHCDVKELFLMEGTKPFYHWLEQILSK